MACTTCNDECKTIIEYVCRVCELIDGDTSIKRVCFCNDCGAYICDDCRPNLTRRALAAIGDKAEKVKEFFQGGKDKNADKKDKDPGKMEKEHLTDEFSKEDERVIHAKT